MEHQWKKIRRKRMVRPVMVRPISRRLHRLIARDSLSLKLARSHVRSSAPEEKSPDWREGQQESNPQQYESGQVDCSHSDRLSPPETGQSNPGHQPDNDSNSRLAGKRPGRIVEIQRAGKRPRCLGSESQDADSRATNTGCENGGSPRSLGIFSTVSRGMLIFRPPSR